MKVTFGMFLDGASWSEEPASLGEIRTGPWGLLQLLETHLGLTGQTLHPARRIAQYLERLKQFDHEEAWFHASFEADSWSTAKRMLEWRDQLVEAGWRGQAIEHGSQRLQALSELEGSDKDLAPGKEDRLREVLTQLNHLPAGVFARVLLREPLELLPAAWQMLFNELREKGTVIENEVHPPGRPKPTNLSLVQSRLAGGDGAGEITSRDDSLLLLEAGSEWEAAETLALWLAADAGANAGVTIIHGEETGIVDEALRRHGLPALGGSASSRWRASLQVLPLAIANAWKPVDVRMLVELLQSPLSPIPPSCASRLLWVLGKEPGVGGKAWSEAIAAIAKEREKHLAKNGQADPQAEARDDAGEIDALLSTDRYHSESGIPEEALMRRCQWVIKRLQKKINDPLDGIGTDPAITEAISHARELLELSTGRGTLPRVTVERMLDSVIGVGSRDTGVRGEAAPWEVVDHPGKAMRRAETVVWWGFDDPRTDPAPYWSQAERKCLEGCGIAMDKPGAARARESLAWRHGFLRASDRVLLFYPRQKRGEPTEIHPFWDEILQAAGKRLEQAENKVSGFLTRTCGHCQGAGKWELAGRPLVLEQAVKVRPVAGVAVRQIPQDAVAIPEKLSYSQMSIMLGCPMNWALKYHACLKIPAAQMMPTGDQMIGTLCHRIVQELVARLGGKWSRSAAEAGAGELYDSLVAAMAAELLLPGNELENRRCREAVVHGIGRLADAIGRLGLRVEKSEEKLEGNLGGIPFIGYADLLLRDDDGRAFVLDLKWSKSSRYRREEIEDGQALQLATYAWMLRTADPAAAPHAGYFMLAQGEMLSSSPLLKGEALASKRSLNETWEMGENSWMERFEALRGGLLEAGGVNERLLRQQSETGADEDDIREKLRYERENRGLLYVRPPCAFCDFSSLCGLGGVS